MKRSTVVILAASIATLLLAGCSRDAPEASGPAQVESAPAQSARRMEPAFTIAVIPDPRNYIAYDHQRATDFPLNAATQYLDQMRYVAAHAHSMGGEIAFMTVVGDTWNNSSPADWVRHFELPASQRATSMVDGRLPFSIVPGDRDFDTSRVDSKVKTGQTHSRGLTNFVAVYGAGSRFFKDKPWYVASNDGGADSAQVFEAGGYRWLHIGLQFRPPDSSLDWAAGVIAKHPGLPTIVTTHDHLDPRGERPSVNPAGENSPESVWKKFLSKQPQIFLVLSGHHAGQSRRIDKNDAGHDVHQLMASYHERFQSALDVRYTPAANVGIGDGWLRLMRFEMDGKVPTIDTRTYSTHYARFSGYAAEYARWYRAREQPAMTNLEFLDAENFLIELTGFRERFDATAKVRQ